jgi:hypothetical protein
MHVNHISDINLVSLTFGFLKYEFGRCRIDVWVCLVPIMLPKIKMYCDICTVFYKNIKKLSAFGNQIVCKYPPLPGHHYLIWLLIII